MNKKLRVPIEYQRAASFLDRRQRCKPRLARIVFESRLLDRLFVVVVCVWALAIASRAVEHLARPRAPQISAETIAQIEDIHSWCSGTLRPAK